MKNFKKIFVLIAIFLVFILNTSAKTSAKIEKARDARKNAVEAAKEYLGCPYQSGAIGPEKFDCSGLVYTVMKEAAGVQLPRSAKAIYAKTKIIENAEAEAGDLVFFKTTGNDTISHVGIYIGKNQFIHAASDGSKTGVITSSLKEKYYTKTFAGVGQVIPSGRKKNYKDEDLES